MHIKWLDSLMNGSYCLKDKDHAIFNIPAGNYIFKVKAANNDGLWGDEVSALRFE